MCSQLMASRCRLPSHAYPRSRQHDKADLFTKIYSNSCQTFTLLLVHSKLEHVGTHFKLEHVGTHFDLYLLHYSIPYSSIHASAYLMRAESYKTIMNMLHLDINFS